MIVVCEVGSPEFRKPTKATLKDGERGQCVLVLVLILIDERETFLRV